jgi:diguanylate cyclase (GGDEF)-like protein
MPILEDYYAILQVHYLAEPEVIESAYRRLARKYHPDVNKSPGAESRMKKINEAYETLSDQAKRRAYDTARAGFFRPPRPSPPPGPAAYSPPPGKEPEITCPPQALKALEDYFGRIKARDFPGAYDLVSSPDKQNITLDDFVKWQSGVSRVFSLREYSFKPKKTASFVRLGEHVFDRAIDLEVSTVEENTVMGRVEKDTLTKKVVLEHGVWRVYVGYEDINPYITRFEELSALLDAKYAISDFMSQYERKDSGTGLYNRKGFSEAAQREIWRFERYGSVFSVMLIEITPGKGRRFSPDLVQHIAQWAGKILGCSFRNLDILGRWGDLGFIVLLPETALDGCLKAAEKVKAAFENQQPVFSGKPFSFKLNIGIDEFRGSLEDTVRNLTGFIDIAARIGGSSIVCPRGVCE